MPSATPSQRSAGAWPFKLPPGGTVGSISSNTLSGTAPSEDEKFSLPKVLGAWGSAATSIVKDSSGNVVDLVYWIFGGGHGDTGNDGVYAWRASTGKFARLLAPTKIAPAPCPDRVHGEVRPHRPDSQHAYQHLAALDSDEGGPLLLQLRGFAVGLDGGLISGQAHAFDGASWVRFGDVGSSAMPGVSALVKDRARGRFVRFPSGNSNDYWTIPMRGGEWQRATHAGSRPGTWSDVYGATGIHDPVRDLYVCGHWRTPGDLFAFDPKEPNAAFVQIRQGGAQPPSIWGNGLIYRSAADEFLLIDTTTMARGAGPSRVFALKPPASNPLSNQWTWTVRTFKGSVFSDLTPDREIYNRFQYVAAWDALIACPDAGKPMECWKLS